VLNITTSSEATAINDISIGGFNNAGIYDAGIDSHFNNVFVQANASGALLYESERGSGAGSTGDFGKYFHGGVFVQSGITTNQPCMLFHTTGTGDFFETFCDGGGIFDETALAPSAGSYCGVRTYFQTLQENVPAWTTPNAAYHTYDVTGCTFTSELYINAQQADSADSNAPLINVTNTGAGSGQVQNTVIMGGFPSGPLFHVDPAASVAGTTLINPATGPVGLFAKNTAGLNSMLLSGTMFNNGGYNGFATGVPVGASAVALAEPYLFNCTASNSGGSLAAGTYFVLAAYYDMSGPPTVFQGQDSSEIGPLTTTGSSGSISCTWTPSTNTIIGGIYIFTGSSPSRENVKYDTTNSGSYTITSAGVTGYPTQLAPDPKTAAFTTMFGKLGGGGFRPTVDYTGTDDCVAFGKEGCTTDTTPGDVQISNKLTAGSEDLSAATAFLPPSGTSLPATCTVGQVFLKTNATAGQNWYFCTSTNTWTQQLNNGGGTQNVYTGTLSLGTSKITAGTCATTATATATGANESTDNVIMNTSAAIKGVTGYFPATSGAGTLTLYPPYITSNTVNVDECNWTLNDITPGGVTLTFHVIR